MTGKKFCELCGEAGLSSRLVPYQMNSEEAILICENSECVFPLGTPRLGNFVVPRKATEISNTKRKRTKTPFYENILNSSSKSTIVSTQEQFLNWENADALCWLDCAMSLIVHNQTFRNYVSMVQSPNSLLKSLVESYSKAQLLLSDSSRAKEILHSVRQTVWNYLVPKMKCSLGVNDSPVFAIPLLLKENIVTLENCVQEHTWKFSCSSCGYTERTRQKKYIVTFPNTPNDFDFQHGLFLKTCPKCKSVEQKSNIIHEKMPDVVLMHFVEGLKSQNYLASKFIFNNNIYQLTQYIQYSRNPDHFICWTKESNGTRWLELDDLKPPVCSWSNSAPKVPPSEVHIVVFEKITLKLSKNTITEDKLTDSRSGIVARTETCSATINKDISNSLAEVHLLQEHKEERILCMETSEVGEMTRSNDANCSHSENPTLVNINNSKTLLAQRSLQDKRFIHHSLKEGQNERIYEQNTQGPNANTFDLQQKSVLNESLSPKHLPVPETNNDIYGRFPLQKCLDTSGNSVIFGENVNTVDSKCLTQTKTHELEKTPFVNKHSPQTSLLKSPSLDNSFIKVALKKYSSHKKFQPLLNNKRRALSCQFQPYVPKKQRLESPSDLNRASLSDFDHHSDSGYSSPSSVGSCGSNSSAASIETEQKISVTDDFEKMEIEDQHPDNIAEELEKLLPDCLLNAGGKRASVDDDQIINGKAMELTSISREQDHFIKSLLFDD